MYCTSCEKEVEVKAKVSECKRWRSSDKSLHTITYERAVCSECESELIIKQDYMDQEQIEKYEKKLKEILPGEWFRLHVYDKPRYTAVRRGHQRGTGSKDSRNIKGD